MRGVKLYYTITPVNPNGDTNQNQTDRNQIHTLYPLPSDNIPGSSVTSQIPLDPLHTTNGDKILIVSDITVTVFAGQGVRSATEIAFVNTKRPAICPRPALGDGST
ncbi:hypothetical protein JTE90_021463 [Oedothorax gibbosus]|uniref:Uncharacterized protein n=1 Tax=Oedothorax gibbosus TaxID=931172 RepID=A0AAV6VZ99_9ARAC|nr:hypothetical protein JTE90_021463 [Oedothorax gibbosus]